MDNAHAIPSLQGGLPHPHSSSLRTQIIPTSLASRYAQHHQLSAPDDSFYSAQRPRIDVDALAAGVQRYIPSAPGRVHASYPHSYSVPHANNNSYIALPPGVDPATVDFRTFYPYNPSEVKHRKRTTRPQLKVLEETFKKETKPNAALRKSLAAQLEMTPRGVQVWFQNRRAKEKTLAKKASCSAGKSINQDTVNRDGSGDADGDGDADHDEDVVADNGNADCEDPTHTSRSAPGAAPELPKRSLSHSSSTSPESTSPEATPPNLPADIPPRVSMSPPVDEDDVVLDAKQRTNVNVMGVTHPSSQGPPRSMSRTPTYGMSAGMDIDVNMGEAGSCMNIIPTPAPDQFLRRPSLPTHLGGGSSRVRAGYFGGVRGANMSIGALGGGRFAGFDPNSRRMSLDRLASHPYAHLAAQANTMVYGNGPTRYRPTLPGTTQSTPTLTPQAHTSELPQIDSDDGNNNNGSPSMLPELTLPPHLQHPPISPPAPDLRPELLHRQSLPAHFALPPHFSPTPDLMHAQMAPPSGSRTLMRLARPGQMYALSARSYQPPIPGPLPNPDFSFGSPHAAGNEESESAAADGGASSSGTPGGQLQNFQFPTLEGEKDDDEGTGMETVSHTGLGGHPSVYFRDAHGVHGAVDPYASRFGSIASIASIAESESSATSGGYYSEAGSFDVHQDGSGPTSLPAGGFSGARRPSYTGQMMDMFSNLDVQNGSSTSLSHSHDVQKSQSSGIMSHQAHSQTPEVPISKSSELALALTPGENSSLQSSCVRADNGSNYNVNISDSSDTGSFNQSQRSSMSSSELPLTYPMSDPPSVNSSRSSLGMCLPPPPTLSRLDILDTDNLDFMHNYDAISETGHYSPVSHPGSAAFEFPPSNAMSMPQGRASVSTSVGSIGGADDARRGNNHDESAMMPHLYTQDEQPRSAGAHQQQHQSLYTVPGPFGKGGSYQHPPCATSFPIHVNAADNVATYGYYN